MTTIARQDTSKAVASTGSRAEGSTASALAGSRMTDSRVIGGLFVAGYLAYGVGFALVMSVVGAPNFLATVAAQQTTLIIGAFLMLLNSVVDVGKAVLFFPILERHGKRTALAYLATMIVEVVLLDIGALALLMIVPLAQQAADAGAAGAGWATALGSLAVQSNAMAYNLGEIALAIGALFLCALLLRTRLVPRFFAIAGLIGYPVLMVGCIAEILGLHIGVMLTIPGMVFELGLPVWLILKGFQPQAYGAAPPVEISPALRPAPVGR
jgi:hypothetical protein